MARLRSVDRSSGIRDELALGIVDWNHDAIMHRSLAREKSDAEFLCRFNEDRRPYPAISLTANGEFMTAVCNDYGADEIFARQVQGLGEKGDVLIAFTTSGKSKNVLRALEEAKRKKIESICFLGRDGGFTKGIATIDLIVQGNSTARIQEGHKLLMHVLCETVDEKLPRK